MPDPINNEPASSADQSASVPLSGTTEGEQSGPESPTPTPTPTLPTEPNALITPEVTTEVTPPVPAPVQPINLPNPPFQGGQRSVIDLLIKAREKIQFRKRAKLEKIMAAASSKASQAGSGESSRAGITNDEVQKLLRVSDKTAERYLGQLVKQGRLRRAGPANHSFYQV